MNSKSVLKATFNSPFCLKSFFACLLLLICRVVSMIWIPLNDVSEARYAEIARKMLETGNWVTLQHDYGVPFWAKPPLSTWMSALSMSLFGVNEFAVRLPGLLCSLIVLGLIWHLAQKQKGHLNALLNVLVLSGTFYFFLNAGTVMTDPALVMCTTLIIVSFWHSLNNDSRVYAYLFFVGIGLGLLAKGPVAIVLAGMPIFFWVLIYNQWQNLWKKLPWVKGILLSLIIALPWYIWAEFRTPGFLNYFIVGEHFHRFLTPGWTGDKYGFAHQEHWGMIWVFASMGIFPWCFLGLYWLAKYRNKLPNPFSRRDCWFLFTSLCTFIPLAFFTFSSNIIYTYVFPIIPFFALFFTEFWWRAEVIQSSKNTVLFMSLLSGIIFLTATAAFHLLPNTVPKTHKPVIDYWSYQPNHKESLLVYWDYKTDFSAQFYSAGKVRFTQNNFELCYWFDNGRENYLVVAPSNYKQLLGFFVLKIKKVAEIVVNGKPLWVFKSQIKPCDFT